MNRDEINDIISGNIQITHCDDDNGNSVAIINGDPHGLRSLGEFLIKIAKFDQSKNSNLPHGEREHFHLEPCNELSLDSDRVIVGRLDAKETGKFPEAFNNVKRNSSNEIFELYLLGIEENESLRLGTNSSGNILAIVNAETLKEAKSIANRTLKGMGWQLKKLNSWSLKSAENYMQDHELCADKKEKLVHYVNRAFTEKIIVEVIKLEE